MPGAFARRSSGVRLIHHSAPALSHAGSPPAHPTPPDQPLVARAQGGITLGLGEGEGNADFGTLWRLKRLLFCDALTVELSHFTIRISL
jgi:hypothetical protein